MECVVFLLVSLHTNELWPHSAIHFQQLTDYHSRQENVFSKKNYGHSFLTASVTDIISSFFFFLQIHLLSWF